MPTELTKDNLEQTIEDNDIVIIDFWADWCGPCKMFGPVFEKAAEAHPEITFAKCNTEQQPEVAATFGIRSIPTIAVFRERVMLFMEPGALPAAGLDQLIDKVKELDMDEVRAEIAKQQPQQEEAVAQA